MRHVFWITLLAAALAAPATLAAQQGGSTGGGGGVEKRNENGSQQGGVEKGGEKGEQSGGSGQGAGGNGGEKGDQKGDAKGDAKGGDAKAGTGEQGKDPQKPTETEVIGLDDVEELPAGADPSDIRAMRSAQQMLLAERRLKDLIKSGDLKDVDRFLTFEEISSWPYEDGLKGIPKAVKRLDGDTVMMTGFMLPIDEVEDIKEFLLVQSLWSCCYGQPPDINGIVRVVMQGKKRVDYQFEPIKLIGKFKVVATVEDGYCVDIFQLLADQLEVIQ